MHQAKQAIRVANVPADVFDVLVEDTRPATVTQLAEMGKREAEKLFVAFLQHIMRIQLKVSKFFRQKEPYKSLLIPLISEGVLFSLPRCLNSADLSP